MITQTGRTRAAVLGILIAGLLSVDVIAHHGPVTNPALYRAEGVTELEGEVTDVFWQNPHPRFRLRVVDDTGQTTLWELELNGSPISWGRVGLGADDFPQAGDDVRVAGFVSRRDPHSMGVLHLLMPGGAEFVNGRRELRWSDTRVSAATPAGTPLDSATVEAAERSARGIFRVWGRDADGTGAHPPPSQYTPLLTEAGRELAAAYDPVTQNPELDCEQGMPGTMFDPVAMQIIEEDDRILIRVQEYDIERVVHMNAEPSAPEPERTALGYSAGRWEGDTLVVETSHVDFPYIDPYGTPQSDQARYHETFTLADSGDVLNYVLTVTDPLMFVEPFTLERPREWTPGVELVPYNCIAQWESAAG